MEQLPHRLEFGPLGEAGVLGVGGHSIVPLQRLTQLLDSGLCTGLRQRSRLDPIGGELQIAFPLGVEQRIELGSGTGQLPPERVDVGRLQISAGSVSLRKRSSGGGTARHRGAILESNRGGGRYLAPSSGWHAAAASGGPSGQ